MAQIDLGLVVGTDGEDGVGVPSGGTTGQVLTKKSNTDNDTQWSDPAVTVTKTSQLTNDSGYATTTEVNSAISAAVVYATDDDVNNLLTKIFG